MVDLKLSDLPLDQREYLEQAQRSTMTKEQIEACKCIVGPNKAGFRCPIHSIQKNK